MVTGQLCNTVLYFHGDDTNKSSNALFIALMTRFLMVIMAGREGPLGNGHPPLPDDLELLGLTGPLDRLVPAPSS